MQSGPNEFPSTSSSIHTPGCQIARCSQGCQIGREIGPSVLQPGLPDWAGNRAQSGNTVHTTVVDQMWLYCVCHACVTRRSSSRRRSWGQRGEELGSERGGAGVREAGLHSVQLVDGVHSEVGRAQLHDGGLQRVPPAPPGDPHQPVVGDGAVGPAVVVESVKMSRVAPGGTTERRVELVENGAEDGCRVRSSS